MKINKDPQFWLGSVKNFLKVDLELTNLHLQNPYFDFQSFNWIDYISYCKEMQKNIDGYFSELLKGFCFLKTGLNLKGKNTFEKLLGNYSNNGFLQALYADSLFKLNDRGQAKSVFNFLNQVDEKQILIDIILRISLLSRDTQYVQKIINSERFDDLASMLYSHWSDGFLFLKKEPEKARTSVQLGLQVSPRFTPLLRLKNNDKKSF